ncbi:MAG: hypothetical protein JWR80_10069 [Bradyrhizobium sp.]|nr:hypothetical protein [Bradyrhizobium sp.]
MANALLTRLEITRKATRLFTNSNMFIKNIDRQYDNQFAVEGAKIGATLKVRLPNDYVVTDGPGLSVQDTAEQQTTLTVATQRHIDTGFTTAERALSLDDFAERILKPKLNTLAGNVAQTVMTSIGEAACNARANFNGAAIISPTQQQFLEAGAILDDNGAPMMGTKGDRKVVNDPWTDARTASSLTGLFNPSGPISEQYATGTMKQALGFSWMRDQTVIKHLSGTFTAGTVNGAGQSGTTLVTNAITGTLKQGDVITIAGVNAVNYTTKVSTGMARQFVVTANVLTAAVSIPIFPAIIAQNAGADVQYQTVVSAPADGAAITLFTQPNVTYRKSLAYAPEAVTLVTADLYMPTKGVIEFARAQHDGISLRSLAVYVAGTDQAVDRLDVLFGWLAIRPQWMVGVYDVI